MLEVRIHGYGGEGAVTLSELIASAALKTGRQVQSTPSFGSERRGAPVKVSLRVSDTDIWRFSQIYYPDLLLVMNHRLLGYALSQGIKPDGSLLVNTPKRIDSQYSCTGIDAVSLCVKQGLVVNGIAYINIPLSGAACCLLGIDPGSLETVVRERWKGEVGENNARVAVCAYNMTKNHMNTFV